MVTRALSAGDRATVKQVYNAVGPHFLARLLLPLRKTLVTSSQQQQSPFNEETAQKQVGMAALGLAVLSSAAQVEEIASSQDFMQLTPLFLNVARASGVSPLILAPKAAELSQVSAKIEPETDAASVRDALECAVAVATSSEEGRQIAEDSGALQAAADVLRCFAKASSETNTPPAGSYQTEFWAVRLISAILAAGSDRASIIESNTAAIEALVPGLAYAFALPAFLPQENEKRQAAALHLESLHALLLILPLPLPQAHAAHEFLTQGALQSLWAKHMRLGIGMILRSNAAAVQRHSALQLAAAMVGMFGHRWLFYPLGQPLSAPNTSFPMNNNSTPYENEGSAFYQLLLEVVKVETNVLLYDALSPLSHVPSSSEPGIAAKDWKAPMTTSTKVKDTYASDGEYGDQDKGGIDIEEIETIEHSAKSREGKKVVEIKSSGGDKKKTVTSVVDGIDIEKLSNSTNTWAHGPSESAGDRALQMLPCCFFLLEACIEALAEDNDEDEIIVGGGHESGLLNDAVAARALGSLLACVDVLLQVIEEEELQEEEREEDAFDHGKTEEVETTISEKEEEKSSSDDSRLNSLKLGAVRVLGRFFAEVPDAFEQRVKDVLPRLLSISSSTSASSSLLRPCRQNSDQRSPPGFPSSLQKVEGDTMLDSFGDFIQKVQSPRKSGASSDGKNLFSPAAEGISFFLPMLLQVTDPSRPSNHVNSSTQWVQAIVQGGSLRQLVDFAVETSEVMTIPPAAASAPTQQGRKEENQKLHEEKDLETSFMIVCRVLLQIITQVEKFIASLSTPASSSLAEVSGTTDEGQRSNSVALDFAVADASWPLIPALTELLSKYFTLATLQGRFMPTTTTPPSISLNTSPTEEEEKIACLAALLAGVLEAVADEADHPDKAHRSEHELFTRRKFTRGKKVLPQIASVEEENEELIVEGDFTTSSGMGPVCGDDVKRACELVLRSIHKLTLENNKGNASVQLKDDFRCLVHSAQCLLNSCSAFRKVAVEKFLGSSPEEFFEQLSLE